MNGNLILIGMPGSSKSTVGKALATKKNMLFFDSDKRFEELYGNISRFFERCGEAMFRVEESRILYDFSKRENAVISCGGGAVLNPAMNYLKDSGTVVLLTASPDTIVSRLKGDTSRPLLRGVDQKAQIKKLLSERKELYKKYADIVVATDDLSVDETVEKILSLI